MEEHVNESKRPRTARELRKAKEAEEERKRRKEGSFNKVSETEVSGESLSAPSEEEAYQVSYEEQSQEELHTDYAVDSSSDEGEESIDDENYSLGATNIADLEELQTELEKWKRQAEENKEQLLRARADYENFRRRSRKDQEDAVKYGATSLVESLLPVLDNLERALAVDESTSESNVLRQGVDMVYRQLLQSLTEKGLSVIEAEGKEFNPHEHTAVMQEEAEGVGAGMVIEELQKGYRFKERILRPAMVKVSY
ncbi:molecular chaperone GrpE [Marininema mesophilum]|uniref:Protein GrpE n=1 Tax=Marininema mesophilum TaxID=1048340 RepID=A0A1H2R826_9BACL|nr:nucleotide exchange factor GrpE [Marininema mesophilum]SDW15633.1 molecular chaperone GrpE [Marininema mesophilum]